MQSETPEESYLYVIGLGSNLGDRAAHLKNAVRIIDKELGRVIAEAHQYETAPVGAADQPFLNSALLLASKRPPGDLMRDLLQVEQQLGRVRTVKWGNRVIDLDLLMARREGKTPLAQEDECLSVPHPHLLDRDFALVPAAEVAGDWTHPATGRTLGEEVADRGYRL